MDIHGITNLEAFDERERYHIRSLHIRKQTLEQEEKRQKLGRKTKAELEAFRWLFQLLDEISEE